MITGTVILKHDVTGVIPVYNDGGAPADSYLLMESGFYVLLENGDYIILE